MDLVKSWLGQALRATGAAVVVPVAVLLALSLTAIGGGGLGGLTQIVSGPEIAGSGLRVDDGDREIGRAVSQLADRSGGQSAAGGSPGTVAPGDGSGGGDTPTGGDGDAPGGGSPPGDGGPPGGGSPPGGGNGGGGGTPPAAPPPPTPPPPEPPGTIEGVGETVTGVTEGTPVAPTVEDAVDGLVETCRRMDCP